MAPEEQIKTEDSVRPNSGMDRLKRNHRASPQFLHFPKALALKEKHSLSHEAGQGCQISLEPVPPDSTTIPTKILRSRPRLKRRLHAVVLNSRDQNKPDTETQSSFLKKWVVIPEGLHGGAQAKSRAQRPGPVCSSEGEVGGGMLIP